MAENSVKGICTATTLGLLDTEGWDSTLLRNAGSYVQYHVKSVVITAVYIRFVPSEHHAASQMQKKRQKVRNTAAMKRIHGQRPIIAVGDLTFTE
jgi:hypothetical protein